jgi:hypothetical protein
MTDYQIISFDSDGLQRSVEFSDSTALCFNYFTDPSHTVLGTLVSISCYNKFKTEEVRFPIEKKSEASFYVEVETSTFFLTDRVPNWLVDEWLDKIQQAVNALKLSQIEVRSRPLAPWGEN